MKLSDRLKELAASTKEYCQFLEDELIHLKGVGRDLENLAFEQERLENPVGKMPSQGGNKCNFPIF